MNDHTFCRLLLHDVLADAKAKGVAVPKKLTGLIASRQQYFLESADGVREYISACCAWEAKAKYISKLIDQHDGSR
jgi:hypothetical protein